MVDLDAAALEQLLATGGPQAVCDAVAHALVVEGRDGEEYTVRLVRPRDPDDFVVIYREGPPIDARCAIADAAENVIANALHDALGPLLAERAEHVATVARLRETIRAIDKAWCELSTDGGIVRVGDAVRAARTALADAAPAPREERDELRAAREEVADVRRQLVLATLDGVRLRGEPAPREDARDAVAAAARALLADTMPVPLGDGDDMDCFVCDGDRAADAVDHHAPGCAWRALWQELVVLKASR